MFLQLKCPLIRFKNRSVHCLLLQWWICSFFVLIPRIRGVCTEGQCFVPSWLPLKDSEASQNNFMTVTISVCIARVFTGDFSGVSLHMSALRSFPEHTLCTVCTGTCINPTDRNRCFTFFVFWLWGSLLTIWLAEGVLQNGQWFWHLDKGIVSPVLHFYTLNNGAPNRNQRTEWAESVGIICEKAASSQFKTIRYWMNCVFLTLYLGRT